MFPLQYYTAGEADNTFGQGTDLEYPDIYPDYGVNYFSDDEGIDSDVTDVNIDYAFRHYADYEEIIEYYQMEHGSDAPGLVL